MTKETRTKNQQTIADSFNYCVNGELAELIALEELRKIELENLRKIKLDELKKLEELRKLRESQLNELVELLKSNKEQIKGNLETIFQQIPISRNREVTSEAAAIFQQIPISKNREVTSEAAAKILARLYETKENKQLILDLLLDEKIMDQEYHENLIQAIAKNKSELKKDLFDKAVEKEQYDIAFKLAINGVSTDKIKDLIPKLQNNQITSMLLDHIELSAGVKNAQGVKLNNGNLEQALEAYKNFTNDTQQTKLLKYAIKHKQYDLAENMVERGFKLSKEDLLEERIGNKQSIEELYETIDQNRKLFFERNQQTKINNKQKNSVEEENRSRTDSTTSSSEQKDVTENELRIAILSNAKNLSFEKKQELLKSDKSTLKLAADTGQDEIAQELLSQGYTLKKEEADLSTYEYIKSFLDKGVIINKASLGYLTHFSSSTKNPAAHQR